MRASRQFMGLIKYLPATPPDRCRPGARESGRSPPRALRQQMRIALDQRHARPAALDLERQEIAMHRAVPRRPRVAQIVGRELAVEPGAGERPIPALLDLPTIGAAPIAVRPARR